LAAELRWILLALGLPLLAGIWWWTARRSRQIPGNAELRESSVGKPPETQPALDVRPQPEPRDWGVSPLEPLSVRTAEFDEVPVLDGPMMVHADPVPAMQPRTQAPPSPAPSSGDSAPAPSAATDLQRIVTIRVCAVGEARWSGARLMTALETHGLAFGRYQVFHRKHPDGRSLFCVASLIEPGIFDVAEMADQEFRGITLFAVLPGPMQPLETMDELLATAHGLAQELSGMVQDGKGMPMSPQRAAALREDIARFQAALAGNQRV
jgi:cell division protein ZipA